MPATLTKDAESKLGNQDYVYYLKTIIFIVIMFGFGLIPPVEPLTPLGMKVLGVFLGCLFGWVTIGLIWPSIFGLLGLVLVGSMTLPQAFAAGWGCTTQLLIFFTVVVTLVVDQAGVSNFIAMFLITRKFVLGRPWLFIFAFLCSVYVLSAITSSVPTIILSWSILYSICKQVGYKPFEPFPTLMTVGVVMTATLGLAVFPFKIVALTVFGVLESIAGLQVDYLAYVLFTIPMGLFCILFFTVIGRLLFKVDVSLLKQLNEDSFKDVDLNLNKHQKYILGFLIILVVLLLLPSVLPKTFFLAVFLNKIKAAGTAALIVALMCAIKVDGKPLMNFREATSKRMQWDVLFITATTMPLASALTADGTGITPFLLQTLGPIFEDKMTFTFLIIAIATAVFFTQFAVNNLTGAVLLPVFYPFALELGISPIVLGVLITFACHFALLTPAASPMATMMHGNSDWLTPKDTYKYSFIIAISSFLVTCIIGIPYASFLFT